MRFASALALTVLLVLGLPALAVLAFQAWVIAPRLEAQATCTVTTAAQMQARAADSPGQTCTVSGAIGSVTLTARPAQVVTFTSDGTASYSTLTFDGAANIKVYGGRVTGSAVFPSRTGKIHTTNIVLTHLDIGGTATARSTVPALVNILDGVDKTTIRDSRLHHTLAGSGGFQGYAIRAVNGDRDRIAGLTVWNNHIDHIASDGAQLAGVASLVFSRNELGYIAAEPGSTEHSDSLQILSQTGTVQGQITRNHIHHVGFFDEQAQPDDGYPAGQLLVHGWSDVPTLFQDNLLIFNRNYEPIFKDESTGAVADNWTFDHNTILHNGPPQPSAERAGFWRGNHALTNNILGRMEGTATFNPASNNFVANGSCAGCTLDTSLMFTADWLSTDHPTAGIRQKAGPDW